MLFALAGCASLWAQGSATIFGAVTDSSGAVAPGVTVLVANEETGVTRESLTDARGDYVVVQLPVGVYTVSATADGFKESLLESIRLQVDENRRVDVRIEVGAVSEKVTVEATAAQVDTRTGTLREVIDARRITDLPLNGRNPLQLLLLVPGVSGERPIGQEQNSDVQVNGVRSRSGNYSLDGGDNHDPFFNSPAPFPNPDSLQEFSINMSAYSADRGRNGGAAIAAITKSGTNEVHGAVFEFLRNEKLNARSFFADSVPPFRRNQFGASVGGPLWRNHTFFFLSYQGTRERSAPGVRTANVLTQQERGGDFSELARQLARPDGPAYENNIIPLSEQSVPAQRFLEEFVPLPTRPDGFLSFNDRQVVDDDQVIVKVDHQVTDANHLYGRLLYNDNESEQTRPANLPSFSSSLAYRNGNVTLGDTHVFGPNVLNNFTFTRQSIDRSQYPNTPGNLSWEDLGSGLKRSDVDDTPVGHEDNVVGYFRAFTALPLTQPRVSYQISDQVNMTFGSHQLRVGFDYRRGTVNRFEYFGNPSTTFNGQQTGDARADLLIGRMWNFTQSSPNRWLPRGQEYDAYVQDDWKVTRRLTLNLGLRWDPFLPFPDRQGLGSLFLPGRQSTLFPRAPEGLLFEGDASVPKGVIRSRPNLWSPRFGFAWDPFGDGRTSIRGGYGLFNNQLFLQGYDRTVGPALSLRITLVDPPGGLEDPYSTLPGGYPYPYRAPQTAEERQDFDFTTPFAMTTYDPDYRPSQTQQWNFNIQRQLGRSYVVTAAYVGNKGNFLHMGAFDGGGPLQANPAIPGPGSVQSRRLYPDFSSINQESARANSLYHALQLSLNKRMANGFTILSSYTFASLMGDQSGDDIFNLSQERGRLAPKHRYVGSFIWELPKLANAHPVAKHVLGGWETNGILTLQSGPYLTFFSGGDRNNNGQGRDRADLIGNPFLDTGRSRGEVIERYYNPAAFAPNGPGSLGNSGRGILAGPGLATVDFGLLKNIPVHEDYRLQFRAEFFNLFNRVNLLGPIVNVTHARAGAITETRDPRVIQMALKFIF